MDLATSELGDAVAIRDSQARIALSSTPHAPGTAPASADASRAPVFVRLGSLDATAPSCAPTAAQVTVSVPTRHATASRATMARTAALWRARRVWRPEAYGECLEPLGCRHCLLDRRLGMHVCRRIPLQLCQRAAGGGGDPPVWVLVRKCCNAPSTNSEYS